MTNDEASDVSSFVRRHSGAPVFSAQAWQAIVGGRRRGVRAALWCGVLGVAGYVYSAAMRIRNWRYDRGWAEVLRVGAPVVCVGNLTLGGTGKTPLVEWIARRFRAHGVRAAIVSRGYGSAHGVRNDEALELEQKLPDVPHLQNADRAAGAATAIEEFESQVVLLDDGFQHRRLARDLDIVLLDALEPWGYGRVFPRGLLREPAVGLRRAGAVILSRADLIDAAARREIREAVRRLNPEAVWCEVRHAPRCLLDATGREESVDSLQGLRVVGFCGLGNPEGFRRTLQSLGCEPAEFREFPDHHAYSRADVESLAASAADAGAAALVCTHKDLVKIRADRLGNVTLKALVIGIEFLAGEAELGALIDALEVSR